MTAPNGNNAGFVTRGNLAISIMALAGGVLGYLNWQTNQRLDKIDARIDSVETIFLRKDEHIEFRSRVDERTAGLQKQVDELRRIIVPRTENEEVRTSQEAQIMALGTRLNELRTQISQMFPFQNVVIEIQGQIAELRKQISSTPTK